ncbi:MAG: methylated-DNA--[protein]-cysteine S-methyltransferase, partial [Thermoleophilia bacterium]
LRGTPFDLRVWDELRRLPYGTTTTYTDLAAAVGRPDVVRAVAGAVARTPTPIVVPCHRVIGRDGSLRGYVGGLERKAALLGLERRVAGAGTPSPAQLGLAV